VPSAWRSVTTSTPWRAGARSAATVVPTDILDAVVAELQGLS
jgi:hypothetical protein